ncbi:MAG: hypothetical protein IH851_00195 [Armatimonadetes bacterium]|nr:hypothetical protein [Armatimonadota bacterium]
MSAISHPGTAAGTLTRTRVRVLPRRRAIRLGIALSFLLCVTVLTLVIQQGLMFCCFVLAEQARNATYVANRRAEQSELAVLQLRRQIDEIGNPGAVGDWAYAHDFVAVFIVQSVEESE